MSRIIKAEVTNNFDSPIENPPEQVQQHPKLTLQERVTKLEEWQKSLTKEKPLTPNETKPAKKLTVRRIAVFIVLVILGIIVLINLYSLLFLGYTME